MEESVTSWVTLPDLFNEFHKLCDTVDVSVQRAWRTTGSWSFFTLDFYGKAFNSEIRVHITSTCKMYKVVVKILPHTFIFYYLS